MRIDSSGNVGINVTPSAWNSNKKALQIGNLAALWSDTNITTDLTNNVYASASGILYLTTAAATRYNQQFGAHAWFNAPSGTAGTTATFTQAMTLDISGNLGIGTASPTTKLTISANATVPSAGALSGTNLWMVGAGAANHYLLMDNFASSPNFVGRRSQGTSGSPTAVGSGNNLVILGGFGYGSTGYSSGPRAEIRLVAAETWTDSAQGAYISFHATGIGTTALPERMRLDSSGNLLVGTTTNTNSSTLVVNGTISETVGGVQYPVVSQADIGTAPNDIPLNQYLGSMAYQDSTSVTVGTLSATGVATFSAGTAALPAITTTGDTNTGIFFPAADTIAFSEGGAEAMRIDSSGNVGIGTSSPTAGYKLDVAGAIRTTSNLFRSTYGTVVSGTSGNSSSRFQAFYGAYNSPWANHDVLSLSVNYDAYTGTFDSALKRAAAIQLAAADGSTPFIRFLTGEDANFLERMRIDNAGILLIGTTTASGTNKLQVNSDALINGLTFGRGAGAIASNVMVGTGYASNSTGDGNTLIGTSVGAGITSGRLNLIAGAYSGAVGNKSFRVILGYDARGAGDYDISIGPSAGSSVATGGHNIAIGDSALSTATGAGCIAIGQENGRGSGSSNVMIAPYRAGFALTTGSGNVMLGASADGGAGFGVGAAMTTGSQNVLIGSFNGNQDGLDIRTLNRYVVIADGSSARQISMAYGKSLALATAVPQTGIGITFPATQSASTDANTLDDYEEGTWTPSLGGTATYSQQAGTYKKVGALVYVSAILQVAILGTGSSNQITGYPFACTGGPRNTLAVSYWGATVGSLGYLAFYIGGGGSFSNTIATTALTNQIQDGYGVFQSSTYVMFSGCYHAA